MLCRMQPAAATASNRPVCCLPNTKPACRLPRLVYANTPVLPDPMGFVEHVLVLARTEHHAGASQMWTRYPLTSPRAPVVILQWLVLEVHADALGREYAVARGKQWLLDKSCRLPRYSKHNGLAVRAFSLASQSRNVPRCRVIAGNQPFPAGTLPRPAIPEHHTTQPRHRSIGDVGAFARLAAPTLTP